MRSHYSYIISLLIHAAVHQWTGSVAFRTSSSSECLSSSTLLPTWSSLKKSGSHIHKPLCSVDQASDGTVDVDSGVSAGSDDGSSVTSSAEAPRAAIEDLELCDEISDSFMKYALSIILGRALPDARDGLKVVHRRILWAMQDLKLSASTPYRKCAKVVGDVLGKYHPHSDKSVYDALCRLSQSFMMRVPLVDGHGNFGSADDPPAAMRYTECRLSHFSEKLLLPDISSETVDMLPNFDSTELEPTVLPAKVPMLLINGSSGIAVGLATSIPPHNPDEIISAAILMAKNCGEVDPEALLHIVRGPDFPTGGHISTTMDNLRKIYTTGKGSIMLQAKFSYEERIKPRNSKRESDIMVNTYHRPSQLSFSAGSRVSIIVTELPYNVRLRDVMLSISKGVDTGSLRGISDLRDESDRSGIRLVIDLKKQITTHIEVEEIMSKLKRMTGLCSFFKCNFIALDSSGTKPVRLTLFTALKIWLDFRVDTLRKRTVYLLRHAKERLTIVRGFIIASNHIDEIVRMIRSSPSASEARKNLTDKRFGGLTSDQATAVMRMTLSQLSRMERDKFETEERELKDTIDKYNRLLNDDSNIYALICTELEEIQHQHRKLYGARRRCTSLSVSGFPKVSESTILADNAISIGDRSTEDELYGSEPDTYGDEGDLSDDEPENVDESDSEEERPRYRDPSLIVINNLGWMQRIKLDNLFFTSGRARSIYSSRVYQRQASHYSINSDKPDSDISQDASEENILLRYSLCRPEDVALLIGADGSCLSLPVSRLRLCKRGYSLWKSLELHRTEPISHFMVTSKIRQSEESGSDGKERKKLELVTPDAYLVVGFSDGVVSIMRAGLLLMGRPNKLGISRVRLWRGERGDPVFSLLASVNDDVFVTTAQGNSLRVSMQELVGGMESRMKTQLRLIQVKDGDRVTCGALLEGPFDDVASDTAAPEAEPQGDESSPGADVSPSVPDNTKWPEGMSEEPPPTGRHIILLSESGKGKLIPINELKRRHYGGSGYDIMRSSQQRTDVLVSAVPVEPDDHILLVSKEGLLAQKDPFALRPGLRHHKMRNFWVRINGDDCVKFAVKI
ncbi:putative DNA gyrase A subunit [Babesia divergens]|uniref:DNA gyrase A subunit n=1 Tax=Babesia divergens TaxID=32595 RepID=A0AAD9LGZ8_BABDI|nr:putative DNA gyrase A subunit [Babesia divergens]